MKKQSKTRHFIQIHNDKTKLPFVEIFNYKGNISYGCSTISSVGMSNMMIPGRQEINAGFDMDINDEMSCMYSDFIMGGWSLPTQSLMPRFDCEVYSFDDLIFDDKDFDSNFVNSLYTLKETYKDGFIVNYSFGTSLMLEMSLVANRYDQHFTF